MEYGIYAQHIMGIEVTRDQFFTVTPEIFFRCRRHGKTLHPTL